MSLEEVQALDERYLMHTYRRAPVEFMRGSGARLWDSGGKEYLDFLSGISVCSLGHSHPAVVEAVREQAVRLIHVSNLFYSEPATRLAERLAESSIGGKVFFTNSGTEANECAIKLARKHAHGRGVAEPEIVSLEGAFHGRTMGSLAATPGMARNESFAPMLPGFRSVPRDDPEALGAAVGERTAAMMVEPIQGEAGIYPISDEVLAAARAACDRVGALLILDEIQSGIGRTGSLWAYEQTPVRPDVMTTAKALGGGMPIGACVASPAAADVFEPGDHGSTFAGGALAAAVALAVLSVIDDPQLLRGVRDLGAELAARLAEIDGVREVRGRGLMLGVGLEEGIVARELAADLLRDGLIVNAPESGTLRLLPPLTITGAEVEEAIGVLGTVIAAARASRT
ncbi:MAG: acetylornithine/succinylornithine family transaminase [Actinomycetota bacterium]